MQNVIFNVTDREAIQVLDAKLKEERKQAGELVSSLWFKMNRKQIWEERTRTFLYMWKTRTITAFTWKIFW